MAREESLELRGEDQACFWSTKVFFNFRNSLFALFFFSRFSVFSFKKRVFLCENQLASIKWNLYRERRPFMSRVRVQELKISHYQTQKITRNVLTPGGSNLCAILFVIKNVPFHGIRLKTGGADKPTYRA